MKKKIREEVKSVPVKSASMLTVIPNAIGDWLEFFMSPFTNWFG